MNCLRLVFPASSDIDSLRGFLRALVAQTGRVWPPRSGLGPLVIEVRATRVGISHHLATRRSPSHLVRLATGTLPGLRVEVEDGHEPLPAGPAAGLRLLGPATGLVRTDFADPMSRSLLAGLGGLAGGEVVVIQWLVAPLRTGRRKPAEEPVVRQKRAEMEVVAAGRIAASAKTMERARTLVDRVARLYRQANSDTGLFRQRWSGRVPADVRARRPPWWLWPSHLNIDELVGLLAWPIGPAPIAGLSRGASRLLPPPVDLPRRGPSVALSNYPGRRSRIRLGETGRARHLYVLGPTGVGKTTLLARLISSDIAAGAGLVAVDPLGDMTDLIAERIPDGRIADLMIVDPTDAQRPVGFNLLANTTTPQAVEFVVGAMSRLFAASWGPRTADILRSGLLTLAANDGATLADLPDLLTNPTRRLRYLPAVAEDRLLSGFWQWYEDLSTAERAFVIAPLMNKLRSWLLRPEVVRTLCHPNGALSFAEVFAQRRIVLLRLPKGLLGEETASLIGSLLLATLWRAVLARAAVTATRRRPVYVYLDEFQDYLRLPIGLGDLLAQARGLGVSVVVAHQYLGQLPESMRREVLANIGSRVVFRLGKADAKVMAGDLEPHLSASDLNGLGSREVVVSVALLDRVLSPVTGRSLPLATPIAEARAIRAEAAERYGRPLPVKRADEAAPPIGRRRISGSGS